MFAEVPQTCNSTWQIERVSRDQVASNNCGQPYCYRTRSTQRVALRRHTLVSLREAPGLPVSPHKTAGTRSPKQSVCLQPIQGIRACSRETCLERCHKISAAVCLPLPSMAVPRLHRSVGKCIRHRMFALLHSQVSNFGIKKELRACTPKPLGNCGRIGVWFMSLHALCPAYRGKVWQGAQ